MKQRILFLTSLIVFLGTPAFLSAAAPPRLVITEFLADADDAHLDDDGDSSDWIEIFNADVRSADLEGYFLTDDAGDLQQWRFPSRLLAPGEFLVVFASGKNRVEPDRPLHCNFRINRESEYLGLIAPDGATVVHDYAPHFPPQFPGLSFGLNAASSNRTLIAGGHEGFARVPSNGDEDAEWLQVDFDFQSWRPVRTGVGFELDPEGGYQVFIHPEGDLSALFEDNPTAASAYLILPFEVENVSGVESLILNVQYDDGFAAYLNGRLILAANAPENLNFESRALASRPDTEALAFEAFDLSDEIGFLQPGANKLAVHILNDSPRSSDLLLNVELSAVSKGLSNASEAVYFSEPTPGEPNDEGQTNPGPFISRVTENPDRPQAGAAGEPIVIEAKVVRTLEPVESVVTYYRAQFNAEQSVPMQDLGEPPDAEVGDGVYTAWLPVDLLADGHMLRWRVEASDVKGNAQRNPAYLDPADSPRYYGTVARKELETNLPVLHWFSASPQAANTRTGTRGALFYEGRFYDNVQFDLHGQSTSGSAFRKKSYDIDFNRGGRFVLDPDEPKLKDVNLLTTWADKTKMRHILAYELFRESGVAAHFAFAVRVEQNGVFFSVSDMIEDGDDVYLERAGLNPEGALYKMYNNMEDARRDTIQGVEKKSRKWENHNDLAELLKGIHYTGDELLQYLYDHVDIPKCVNFIAANSVTSNTDLHAKNYYLYRDTGRTDEWCLLPWDLDLSFGRQWNSSDTYFDDRIFVDRTIVHGRGNFFVRVLTDLPEIRAMVLRRIRTLNDRFLQPPDTPMEDRYLDRRIHELLELIDPADQTLSDADLDYQKWRTWGNGNTMREETDRLLNEYLPGRRNFVYNLQTVGNGGEIPPAQEADVRIRFGELEFNPESGDQGQEYIEIVNAGAAAVDVSDWRLRGGIEFDLEPGTVLPERGSLLLSPNVVAFRQRTQSPMGGEGLFVRGNYIGQLSARGETIELWDDRDRLVASMSFDGQPTLLQRYLRLSEVHYAPAPPDDGERAALPDVEASDFEFLELINIGEEALDLSGARFHDGVDFQFPDGAILEAGQRIVVAGRGEAFELRYGAGVSVAGEFQGNLDNAGETVRLRDPSGENVLVFAYDEAWHSGAIARGCSLEVVDPRNGEYEIKQSQQWTASKSVHGTPGTDEAEGGLTYEAWAAVEFSESEIAEGLITRPDSDPDLDRIVNLIEYAYGFAAKIPDPAIHASPQVKSLPGGEDVLEWSIRYRDGLTDLSIVLEESPDLRDWEESMVEGTTHPAQDGLMMDLQYSVPTSTLGSDQRFFRVRFRLKQ